MDTLLGYRKRVGLHLLQLAISETDSVATEMTRQVFTVDRHAAEDWFRNIDQLLKIELLILAGMEFADLRFVDEARHDLVAHSLSLLLDQAKGGRRLPLRPDEIPSVISKVKSGYDTLRYDIYDHDVCDDQVAGTLRNIALSQLIELWVGSNIVTMQEDFVRLPYSVATNSQFLLRLSQAYCPEPLTAGDEFATQVVERALRCLSSGLREFWFPFSSPESALGMLQSGSRKEAVDGFIDEVETSFTAILEDKAQRN